MAMNDRLGQTVVLMFGLAMVCGCAGEPSGPTILMVSEHPYVSDLPLPKDFKLVERQSTDRVMPCFRSVKHVYHGRSSLQAAKNFYQHHMPQANGRLDEQTLNKGVYSLRFTKAQERCEVRIERMPSGLFGAVTQIRASIQSDNTGTPASTGG